MLKVVNMNKKGISPLVATVILIAIVIILALLLWFWYNQWILEQESKGGTELAQACSNTELQIKSSSCENISSTEWRLTFELANSGTSKIIEEIFLLTSDSGSFEVDSGRVLEQGVTLDFGVDYNSTNLAGTLESVKIIPAVSKGSQKKYCYDQAETAIISC